MDLSIYQPDKRSASLENWENCENVDTESDSGWEPPDVPKQPKRETVKVYMSGDTAITFRNNHERYFIVCILNSLNAELYRISNQYSCRDHLDSVVKNLEVARLQDIIHRCTKIFADEIVAFAKKQDTTLGIVPIEVGICLLLVHKTRITRTNISKRNVNTIDKAVQEYRVLKSRPVFFPQKSLYVPFCIKMTEWMNTFIGYPTPTSPPKRHPNFFVEAVNFSPCTTNGLNNTILRCKSSF